MARKPYTNLENNLNVEVFANDRYSKFTHSFKIPFKELETPITVRMSVFNTIDAFSDIIIEALEARMESCVDMLSRNLFNVVESNAHHVLFKKEDGSYHGFNHPSFRNMQEAIGLIKDGESKALKRQHYDQIVKALYWVEKPAPRNGISFGNLISVCMEIIYNSID